MSGERVKDDILERKCATCGKKFCVMYPAQYTYKRYTGKRHAWFCKYSCMREYDKNHAPKRKNNTLTVQREIPLENRSYEYREKSRGVPKPITIEDGTRFASIKAFATWLFEHNIGKSITCNQRRIDNLIIFDKEYYKISGIVFRI